MARAYEYCESVTPVNSRSFHLASALLPADKRQAVRALYAFCCRIDDIVDSSGASCEAELIEWQCRVLTNTPPRNDLIALAWTDVRLRHAVPACYAEQLFEGVERDLTPNRYQTFAELATYCYGVASTVSLMNMHIIGHTRQEAIPYAIKLGIALQLINILRDVGEDWRLGRLYLRVDELGALGLTEEDISVGPVTAAWRAFMQQQIA